MIPEKKILRPAGKQGHKRSFIPKALKCSSILAFPMMIAAISVISSSLLSHAYKPEPAGMTMSQTMNESLNQGFQLLQAKQPKPYAIIVGSFRLLENAENLVSELKAKGHEATIAGQSKTGLFRVSIQSFSDKDEASRQLALVKSNGFPAAWILAENEKVFTGIKDTTTMVQGWLSPRKQAAHSDLPDSVKSGTPMPVSDDNTLFGQYYKLRDVLRQYREIEKNGGWNTIYPDTGLIAYKLGDTATAILQIREHLFITRDLKQNNKSNCYDPELIEAVKKYQDRHGDNPSGLILPEHIQKMNIPINECIKKIMVNMERYQRISHEYARAKEFIVVNIPAFNLHFIRNGKIELQSPVIVGEYVTKTVVFSSMLKSVVFCPYWNVPQSIIDKEIRPGMAKDSNFLKEHNLEWNNGQVRQKPGKYNALGLIKFIFPNSNDIYMHDSPVKSLFAKENRAFSHGCIRVKKSRDLVIAILKDDGWTPGKIDEAIKAGKESTYILKNKIPVYIGYFTTWVDGQGNINFYDDIYNWDDSFSNPLINTK
jgi:murein L,D-transpeptidase YcbB/YkuD